MTIPNRYRGTCTGCRATVPEQKGVAVKVDGKWSVFCAGCAPGGAAARAASTDATIEIRHAGERVRIRPAGYLGRDVFDRYLAACGGAQYDRTERCNYAALDLVGAIVTRLVAAGFKLDVDPDVTAAVQAWEARAKADTDAATGRAAEIDELLRARGLALFPFQGQGVSWLAPRDRAILGDDMGLGKTIQALAALPERAPVLVVGPAVAKGVWARECARWRPDLTVTVLEGRGSFRWPAPGEMVVTNYDITPDLDVMTAEARKLCEDSLKEYRANAQDGRLSDERRAELTADREAALAEDDQHRAFIAACPAGLCVIADEFHAVKGSPKKVARARRFKAIADAAFDVGKGRVWGLTATPILNRPPELWNLLSLIRGQKIVFGSYPNFKRLCGGSDNGWGTTWSAGGISASEVGPKLREVMLRRMKVDVLDQLPAKTVEIVDVSLDAATLRQLDKIEAELAAQGIDLVAALKAAASNQSIAFEQIARARALLATAKAAAAMEMADELEEAGEPCIVFSAHRAPIDVLAKREGWATITGDTPPAERTKIEERFQRGELRGVAGTIKASGVAITLTRANQVIFVDSEWTPKLNEQAEDRAYRIGQARAVQIRYLRANHKIDQRVFELCEVKRGIVARTVDAAAHREGPLAERTDAAAALAGARPSDDRAQRERDAEELAAKVRAARERAAAEVSRRRTTVKAENANRNRGWNMDPELFNTPDRAARDEDELWAVEALEALTAQDGDYANKENDVGFNKADTVLGHHLAVAARAGMLNEGEWRVALKLLRKYHGQVGQAPSWREAAS